MGQIKEELILADEFSAGFSRFLTLGQQSVDKMERLDRTLHEIGDSSRYVMTQGMNEINLTLKKIAENTEQAAKVQREHEKAVKSTELSANRLLSIAGRIAAALGSIKIGKELIGLSDTMMLTQSRLDLMMGEMNSGMKNTEELQNMIYLSAERTRGSYQATADAVSKLGLMAGEAFEGPEEVVAFMEQINKQFKIAGTEASGIQAAMLQLTQAMGSGVLRGEEYNSILEQAPNIIQNIAKYIEGNEEVLKSVASAMKMETDDLAGNVKKNLKDIAGQGLISADLVKAAMFAAADETNEKFESIPMTYADAWTMVKNAGVKSLQTVSRKMNSFLNSDSGQKAVNGLIMGIEFLSSVASGAIDLLSGGASFVVENWDYVYPILIGIGAAFLAAGISGMASGIAAAAAWGPVGIAFIAIGAATAFLIFTLRQAGVSWQEMGEVAGGVLGFLYSYFYTVIAYWWNIVASFAEFFANVFNDPVTAIARLFQGLLDNILQVVQTAAGAIDALLGSDIAGVVSGFRDDISDWVDSHVDENEIKIKRMSETDVGKDIEKGKEIGKDLGSKLDDMNFSFDDFAKNFGDGFDKISGIPVDGLGDIGKVGSVGSVKNVEGKVSLADEDIKLYRDLAERRYLNQVELKTLAPNINVTLPPGSSGNLNAQDVADHIKRMLIEQVSSQTAVAHG